MQELICNDAAFCGVTASIVFLIAETLSLKEYTIINGKQFKNGRMRQNKFCVFSKAICHLENNVTTVFVHHNSPF